MRKAAGIISITLSGVFIYLLTDAVVVLGISIFHDPFGAGIEDLIRGVFLLVFVVAAAFLITGGIFCLMRKYWRVCLASASFGVLVSVVIGGSLLSSNIPRGLIPWVMLVPEVVAVVFIVRRKKEWQEVSDSVDGEVSYDG